MVSRQAARLVAGSPVIAEAHFAAEADPYHPEHNPDGYVNLGTAENLLDWDLLAPALQAARPVGASNIRYAPLFGTAALREQVARFVSRTRGVPVDPADLLVVAGATAALDMVASLVCDPGEVIAVPVPYYGALDTDLVGRSQAVLLPVGPGPDDGVLPGAAAVAAAVQAARAGGATVRALALTSPHNPLGRVYSAEQLDAFAGVCAQLDLHLISDEIYANSVFTRTRFVSALNLDPSILAPDRIHVIWGFAKDFGLPGFKVGVLHTRGEPGRSAARELAYFAPVSTDTQSWLTHRLADDAWLDAFRDGHLRRLADSYASTTQALAAAGIPYAPAEAGFSVWTDLRRWLTEDSFAAEAALWQALFTDGRVSMMPGEVFHSPQPGWFRLCHTSPARGVAEGVARLRRVLTGKPSLVDS
jgi:aspartate/methionine/tyrosine aminotransferase